MEQIKTTNQVTDTNKYPILGEFFNHIIQILLLTLVGALVLETVQGNLSQISGFLIGHIIGTMIVLVIIPFLLSFISLIFFRNREKKSKAFYYTFLTLFALVFIYNVKVLVEHTYH